jgi:hypothetical protein
MPITLNGTTGITTPGLINTGSTTFVDLTTTGNTILGDASTDTLNVANGNLVLNSSGNLGVGTASPTVRLHVSGSSNFTAGIESSNTFAILGFKAVGSTGTMADPTVGIGGTGDALYMRAGGAERVRIDSGGNFGIGTASPNQKLYVVGNGLFDGGFTYWTATGSTPGSTAPAIWSPASGVMGFWTNGAERARIDSNGNLLVGTTVSQQKFMLAGNQRLYNTAVDGLTNSIIGQIDAQVRNYGAGIATNNFSSIQFCTDPTFYYRGDIRFLTNGSDGTSNASTEKARITSGGAFGVGVTPSAWDFSGPGQTPLQTMSWALSNDVNSHYQTNNAYYGSSAWRYIASKFATRYDQDSASGAHKWFIAPTGTAGNGISWTQAMTLISSGSLLIGTTNPDISGVVGWGFNAAGGGGTTVSILGTNEAFTYNNLNTAGTAQIDFRTANVEKGNISWNNSSTSYNTASDYRLKENIAPMTGALARVAQLKPVTYTWKADGSSGEGFVAHELAEVVPQAVTGEKDAVREDGVTPRYQGIDVSFLVATLTAAIQELKAELDSVKSELATIKGAA